MRTTTVKLIPLAALLAMLGGAVIADEPAKPADPNKPAQEQKKPSQLEELIAQALRDNPDIRVAEAKTREAEAELSRVRLQVIQKVVAHQHTVETLEAAVKKAEAKLKLAEEDLNKCLAWRKAVNTEETRASVEQARASLENAKAALQSAKADLAKAQAELPYLLGKGHKDAKDSAKIKTMDELYDLRMTDLAAREKALYALSITQAQAAWQAKELPHGSVAEKLRKALDKPITMKFDDNASLGDVADYLQSAVGVPIVTTLQRDKKLPGINLREVQLGAAMQCLEDVAKVQLGVRDYGILVTDKLPSDVTPLRDFWKGADKPRRLSAEGKVINVDGGMVEVSIGTADGLIPGVTLEVYRAGGDRGARPLGAVRIEKVNRGTSIGTLVNKPSTPVEIGDRVSGSFVVD